MIETLVFVVVAVIVGVNVATTVSTRFRRWVYSR